MLITDFFDTAHPNAAALCDTACNVQLSYGEQIMSFCAERLSAMKVPPKIHLVDSIPRTPTNKVQRQQLSELLNK